MSKGKGRVPMSVPLMEKEIRRLTMLGQRVETEANLRWILLAAVLRKTGAVTVSRAEIDELQALLSAHTATLRVTDEKEAGLRLSFEEAPRSTPAVEPAEGAETPAARLLAQVAPEDIRKHGAPLTIPKAPWWKRVLRRLLSWWALLP